MSLFPILIVSLSFCFWSLLEFFVNPLHQQEAWESQHRSLQPVSLASNQKRDKSKNITWQNLSIPFIVNDHKYSEKCDIYKKDFNSTYEAPKGAKQSWLLGSELARWRFTIIAVTFLYAYNAVPELPAPLISKWQFSTASEPLLSDLRKFGGKRDPDLSIAGPALIDILLPPRANPISKKYLQAKFQQPYRVLGISMPWSTRMQFWLAIGQAVQGVVSAVLNHVYAPWRNEFVRNTMTDLNTNLNNHPALMFRVSVWISLWLTLVRLLIIEVTVGKLIGSKKNLLDLLSELCSKKEQVDHSIWESYPWGSPFARFFLRSVNRFQKYIVPLVMVVVCLTNWQQCIGLLCTVGVAWLISWLIYACMSWLINTYMLPSSERDEHLLCCPCAKSVAPNVLWMKNWCAQHTPLLLATWSLLGGFGIATILQKWLSKDIDICRFSHMVLIPLNFNISNVESLISDFFNSLSVLFYVYVTLTTLLLVLIVKGIFTLYTFAFAKCLPTSVITWDVTELIHAIWLIRSYKQFWEEEDGEEQQKNLRMSMLCAVGRFIHKKKEACEVTLLFTNAKLAAERAAREVDAALQYAQKGQGAEAKTCAMGASTVAKTANETWAVLAKEAANHTEFNEWQKQWRVNVAHLGEAKSLADEAQTKTSLDGIAQKLRESKSKVDAVEDTAKDETLRRVENAAEEFKKQTAEAVSKILVLDPKESTLTSDLNDLAEDRKDPSRGENYVFAAEMICLGALSWSRCKKNMPDIEEIVKGMYPSLGPDSYEFLDELSKQIS